MNFIYNSKNRPPYCGTEHNRNMFMLYYIYIILVSPAHLQSGLTLKVIARYFKGKVSLEIRYSQLLRAV